MNDQEFDSRIREEVQRYESLDIKPQWNKKEVWDRIDAGLVKNNSSWWKAAAIIFVLFSASWSFAQWNILQNYKKHTTMEVAILQQQLDKMSSRHKEMTTIGDLVLAQKNQELDSLRNLIYHNEETSRQKHSDSTLQVKIKASETRNTNEEQLIDSLQNQLKLIKKMLADLQVEKFPIAIPIPKSENLPVTKFVPFKVNILLNEKQEQNHWNRQGLKVHLLGNSKNDNVEYKSDYTIFKKQ